MNKQETFSPTEQERKIITFDDLVDTERNIPEEYKQLISSQELQGNHSVRFNDAAFGIHWDTLRYKKGMEAQFAERELQYFRDHLKGQALIDLGGSYGRMRWLAQRIDAQMYINVDRRQENENQQPNPLHPTIIPLSEGEKTTEIKITSDMLDFISRIKDGSANFIINGIDLIIIDNPTYHEALAKELLRATKSKGLIFGIESRALDILHRQSREQKIDLKEHKLPDELYMPSEMYVFEKF